MDRYLTTIAGPGLAGISEVASAIASEITKPGITSRAGLIRDGLPARDTG